MFTVEERDRVRQRLLELAEGDPDVVAAAITGSYVAGRADEWSDIDLAFGISGDLDAALRRWTDVLERDFGAIHHWDLPWASTVYRVFLLPRTLQVDVAFTPAADFGPRGPNWRTVFGETVELATSPPPSRDEIVGHAWLWVVHARASIGRGRPWSAEYSLTQLREQVVALACLRLGLPFRYARGTDQLAPEIRSALETALVRSLDEEELRRAHRAATTALIAELERTDAALADRLRPTLEEAGGLG